MIELRAICFFIFILAVAVLLYKLYINKGKTRQGERKGQCDPETLAELFCKEYTDAELEDSLVELISLPEKRGEIEHEIIAAYQQMPNWKDEDINTSSAEGRHAIIDIMLANRGKISRRAAYFGYDDIMRSEITIEDRILRYQYIEWIKNTVLEKGVKISLRYDPFVTENRGVYLWEDSPATLPFYFLDAWIGKNDYNKSLDYFGPHLLDPSYPYNKNINKTPM